MVVCSHALMKSLDGYMFGTFVVTGYHINRHSWYDSTIKYYWLSGLLLVSSWFVSGLW